MKKHGEGSARQLENGSWECMVQSKYINPDSKDMSPKRIKRRGRTENEARKKAKQALLVWEKNYEETRLNKKMDKKKTFGQYMDEFIETEVKPEVAGATYKSYVYTLQANFYNCKISNYRLEDLNKVEFETYFDSIIKKKSNKTAKVPMQLCKRCCEWLIVKSLLKENYAAQAKTKKEIKDEYFRKDVQDEKSRKKIFSNEDIIKFYESYKNNMSEYSAAIILILETMMRGQELLALNIDDVDFENNTITIRCAVSERFIDNDKDNGLEKYIKVPKKGKERTIYMTPLAREVIQYMITQTRLKCRDNPQNLVFPSYLMNGKMRSMDAFEIQLKDLCNKLGIDRDVRATKCGRKQGLNVHALRHTAITIANTAPNANVVNTALMAGHTAIRTENIYTHANIEALKNIQTAGGTVLGVGEEKLDNGTKEFLSLMKEKGIKLEKLAALFTD